jgi:hypothetical protein
LQLAKDWLKRFPKWEKEAVSAICSVQLDAVIGRTHSEVWSPDKPGDPLEKRFEAALQNIERLRQSQRNIIEQIDTINDNHKDLKETQEKARADIEKNFKKELERIHTEDVLMSLIGLIWLTVGISLSTMSQEIAKLLNLT